jgi:hypothetical protein
VRARVFVIHWRSVGRFRNPRQSRASNSGGATTGYGFLRTLMRRRHLRTGAVLDRAASSSREVGDAETQEHHHGHPLAGADRGPERDGSPLWEPHAEEAATDKRTSTVAL